MYEKGKRIKGYPKKRLYKKKMKDKFAANFYYGPGCYSYSYIQKMYDDGQLWWCKRLGYWQLYYRSGCRKVAKDKTNRKLRQVGRQQCGKAKIVNIEDIARFPQHSEYQKYFDYGWEVW